MPLRHTLRADDPDGLGAELRRLGVLPDGVPITALARAGEGNMNVVLRAHHDSGSVVVKQTRPFVAKYPTVPAPLARDHVEAAFYTAVAAAPEVAALLPRLLAHDPDLHLLVFEDLGTAADRSDLYADGTLDPADLERLLAWTAALHRLPVTDLPAPTAKVLANDAMRALNAEHVFDLPFRDAPPLDLDAVLPGLEALRRDAVATEAVRGAVAHLAATYVGPGTALVHGDLYPGSWMATPGGLRVLDVEFGGLGDPAWDHGVIAAHLALAAQDDAVVARALDAGGPRARAYAGVEILRRLFGVAQLPLTSDLATRAALTERALTWATDEAWRDEETVP